MTNFDTTTLAAALITALAADASELADVLASNGVACTVDGEGVSIPGYGIVYIADGVVDAGEYRGNNGPIPTEQLVAELIEVIEMVQAVA